MFIRQYYTNIIIYKAIYFPLFAEQSFFHKKNHRPPPQESNGRPLKVRAHAVKNLPTFTYVLQNHSSVTIVLNCVSGSKKNIFAYTNALACSKPRYRDCASKYKLLHFAESLLCDNIGTICLFVLAVHYYKFNLLTWSKYSRIRPKQH